MLYHNPIRGEKMNAATFTRRSLLKAGMALGVAALTGIRLTSKAAAAVS